MNKDILHKLTKLDLNKINLFSLIESLVSQIKALREKNQELKDEINRLKGEKGKPDIKPNSTNIEKRQ